MATPYKPLPTGLAGNFARETWNTVNPVSGVAGEVAKTAGRYYGNLAFGNAPFEGMQDIPERTTGEIAGATAGLAASMIPGSTYLKPIGSGLKAAGMGIANSVKRVLPPGNLPENLFKTLSEKVAKNNPFRPGGAFNSTKSVAPTADWSKPVNPKPFTYSDLPSSYQTGIAEGERLAGNPGAGRARDMADYALKEKEASWVANQPGFNPFNTPAGRRAMAKYNSM